jgi:hypothetical protein
VDAATPLFNFDASSDVSGEASERVWRRRFETLDSTYPSRFDYQAIKGLRGLFAFPEDPAPGNGATFSPIDARTPLLQLKRQHTEDPINFQLCPLVKHYDLKEDYKHDDATTVIRTDHPFPISTTGVSYFEVKIHRLAQCIAVGVCDRHNPLGRTDVFLGWSPENHAYAYHSDNGWGWSGTTEGDFGPYGPSFVRGDVIGCGVDWARGSIFFTKNGIHLGEAFTGLDLQKEPL